MVKGISAILVVLASLVASADGHVRDEQIGESVFLVRDYDCLTFTVRGIGPTPNFINGEGCFSDREFRDFYFEEGLTTIGAYFFGSGLIGEMSSIWMANSVTSIYAHAFVNQQNLKSVRLSSKLEIIGDCAFAYTGLTSVQIPASVKVLGYNAFDGCESLKSVTFLGQTPPATANPGDVGGFDPSVQVYVLPGVDPSPFKALGFQKVNEAPIVSVPSEGSFENVIERIRAGEFVIARLSRCDSYDAIEIPQDVSMTIDLNGYILDCKKLKVLGTLNLEDSGTLTGYLRADETKIGRKGILKIAYGPFRTTLTYLSQGLMLMFK